jgi:hypothetical protein
MHQQIHARLKILLISYYKELITISKEIGTLIELINNTTNTNVYRNIFAILCVFILINRF